MHGDATVAYRRAISLQPDLFEAHYNLANLLRQQGEYGAAEDSLRTALGLLPDHPEAHNNLGSVLQMQGKLDEAIVCYQKAVSLRQDFAGAHCNLGAAFQALHRRADAIASYQKALSLQPDLVEALYNLGNLHEFEEAVPYYRKVLDIDPNHAQARWGITMSRQVRYDGKTDGTPTFLSELAELDAWFDNGRIAHGVDAVGSLQPFFVAYQETNNRDVLARYGHLCARLMKALAGRAGSRAGPQRGWKCPAHRHRIRAHSRSVRYGTR